MSVSDKGNLFDELTAMVQELCDKIETELDGRWNGSGYARLSQSRINKWNKDREPIVRAQALLERIKEVKGVEAIYKTYPRGTPDFVRAIQACVAMICSDAEIERIAKRAKRAHDFLMILQHEDWWHDKGKQP